MNYLVQRLLAGPWPARTTAAPTMQATTLRQMAQSSCELWPQSRRALRSQSHMWTCWRAWDQGRAPCGSAMPSTAPAPGMWETLTANISQGLDCCCWAAGSCTVLLRVHGWCAKLGLHLSRAESVFSAAGGLLVVRWAGALCLYMFPKAQVPGPTGHALGTLRLPAQQRRM